MYPRDIRVNNASEALVVEQALAMLREMQQVAERAADGEVLKEAEAVAVARGREFMRQSLETVLNDQAGAVEKKGRRADAVPAEDDANIGGVTRARSSRRSGR